MTSIKVYMSSSIFAHFSLFSLGVWMRMFRYTVPNCDFFILFSCTSLKFPSAGYRLIVLL